MPPTGFTTGLSEIPRKRDRQLAIVYLRDAGISLDRIGKEFGISRERVRQIEAQYRQEIRQSEIHKLWLVICELWPPQK
jgi:DNA-directed RNA polymerase sigma subunit (sigma70/sigma32)